MKPSARTKRIVLGLVVIAFVATAFVPLAVRAQDGNKIEQLMPGVFTSSRAGLHVPASLERQLQAPGARELTSVLQECTREGTTTLVVAHLRARSGHSAPEALLALLQQDAKTAAGALDFFLRLDNNSSQGPVTTLGHTAGASLQTLQGTDVPHARLLEMFPHLDTRCPGLTGVSAAEALKQLGEVEHALSWGVDLSDGRGEQSFPYAAAARAKFEELVARAKAVRPASAVSYLRGFESGHEKESLTWTLASREVTLALVKKGATWTVSVHAYDLKTPS